MIMKILFILFFISLGMGNLLAYCSSTTDAAQPAELQDTSIEGTTAQYCDYLMERASPKDPYGLYDERMGGTDITPPLIIRSENEEGFTYSVAPGQGETPILFVNHKNQKRFTHWLDDKKLLERQEIETPTIYPMWFYCICGGVRDCSYCPFNFGMCPCD